LDKESYKPFKKSNHQILYVDKKSNHPPTVLKHIPQMVQSRLSTLSKNEQIFRGESKPFKQSLRQAGYNDDLTYVDKNVHNHAKRKNRRRKIIWFNPPFNKEVSTNVAAKFLRLIDKHFSVNSELHKHFNRQTIKVSYSCLPNMTNLISGHNKKLLQEKSDPGPKIDKNCNCQGGFGKCPLKGKCLRKSIIYQAIVTTRSKTTNIEDHQTVQYIGLASNTFKERYNNHQQSFRHEKYEHNTNLSKYIWNLKRCSIPFKIDWSILTCAPSYHPSIGTCKLCNFEKTHILITDHKFPLNTRSEIVAKCRHREKYLLLKKLPKEF
jgi:hypothetical protein